MNVGQESVGGGGGGNSNHKQHKEREYDVVKSCSDFDNVHYSLSGPIYLY